MKTLKPLTLNVIVATFNRRDLLRRTLESLAQAEPAPTLDVIVTVVDNNSTDDTRQVVEQFAARFAAGKLVYLFESKQGRSAAINRALKGANQDLISFVDDDEEIASDWFLEVAEMFGARWDELDFAGGKVLPRFQTEPPPAWVAPGYAGIGWREYGDEEWIFTDKTPILSGGHAIIKREIFDELGFYNEELGATGKNLLSCEDDVMYEKLLNANKIGVYNPRLVIRHFVPDYRLKPAYFRRWCCGNGASQHLVDVYHKPFEGARIFGVPRFMYRTALVSLWQTAKSNLVGERRTALMKEHGFLVFAGYFYERNLKNSRLTAPLRKLAARILPTINR